MSDESRKERDREPWLRDSRLVGMSQSARKRGARIESVMRFLAKDDDQPAWAWHLAHGTGGPRERRAALHAAHEYMATDTRILGREYAEARTAHRIGERLRPCLGCAECLIYDEAAMYDDLGSACDGSGVIPTQTSHGGDNE